MEKRVEKTTSKFHPQPTLTEHIKKIEKMDEKDLKKRKNTELLLKFYDIINNKCDLKEGMEPDSDQLSIIQTIGLIKTGEIDKLKNPIAYIRQFHNFVRDKMVPKQNIIFSDGDHEIFEKLKQEVENNEFQWRI